MTTTAPTFADSLGVAFQVNDSVVISAYGEGATRQECGTVGRVVGFGRTRVRVEFLGPLGFHVRNIGPRCLLVRRRDGAAGLEGNAARRTTPAKPLVD